MAQYYNGYPNMMDGGDWGWGLLMMTFWILIVVGVVVLIVRGTHTHNEAGSSHNDALEIAKQRYAKGEINKEEFEQLKKAACSLIPRSLYVASGGMVHRNQRSSDFAHACGCIRSYTLYR